MEPQALYIYHYKERAGETEHHQKDCGNAEFLRLAEEENILEAVFDSIGMKVGEFPHPSTMIDLFSFSCDLGFLSVTTEDVKFLKLCSKYYTTILAYLDKQQFQYYLSGIYAWESSRMNSQLNLK